MSFDALHHARGHVDRVLAGLLGDEERDRRMLAGRADALLRRGRAGPGPDVARGLVRAVHDLGHVGQVHRAPFLHADHERAHVGRAFEVVAGLHRDLAVLAHELAGGRRHV
jgi:hypothetical protein